MSLRPMNEKKIDCLGRLICYQVKSIDQSARGRPSLVECKSSGAKSSQVTGQARSSQAKSSQARSGKVASIACAHASTNTRCCSACVYKSGLLANTCKHEHMLNAHNVPNSTCQFQGNCGCSPALHGLCTFPDDICTGTDQNLPGSF